MSRKPLRKCGEIRQIVREVEGKWQTWAAERLTLPRCKIKRRGRSVWFVLSHRLADGCRMRRQKILIDLGDSLTHGDVSAWLTAGCEAMTDRAVADVDLARMAQRQQALKLNGAPL